MFVSLSQPARVLAQGWGYSGTTSKRLDQHSASAGPTSRAASISTPEGARRGVQYTMTFLPHDKNKEKHPTYTHDTDVSVFLEKLYGTSAAIYVERWLTRHVILVIYIVLPTFKIQGPRLYLIFNHLNPHYPSFCIPRFFPLPDNFRT